MRYAGNFHLSRYYDNIAGRSFEYRLSLPQPIDIVYTWVNGSDPKLIHNLSITKKKLEKELNITAEQSLAKKRKTINTGRFMWKNASACPLPNCVSAFALTVSGLPRNTQLTELRHVHLLFTLAEKIEFWSRDVDIAFVFFKGREEILRLLTENLKFKGASINASELHYTSTIKAGRRKIDDVIMIHDVPDLVSSESLKELLNSKVNNSVQWIQMHRDGGQATIGLTNADAKLQLFKLPKGDLSIRGRPLKTFSTTYVWMPLLQRFDSEDEDIAMSRFADNNEFKYSLRSVDKFAPWVRRIFVVTNGQIPSWLDLDHPRITLVTHKEIFLNQSHLPTFSSPAIETHIHRIPGLSKKFIYMNDDVFFGDHVWPDDFYTHSKGQKVFLSWPVPNCNEGCPASWINDKYCDKACNVSLCDYDGGDCLGKGADKSNWQLQALQSYGYYNAKGEYCSNGCAHNWIGDRYCDANCNVEACGFDGGDCGIIHMKKLYSVQYDRDLRMIHLPKGTLVMYVNFTDVFHSGSLEEGEHGDIPVLRTSVLSKKYKILSLTFFKNFSESSVPFRILGFLGSNKTEKMTVEFNVTLETLTNVSDGSKPSTTVPSKIWYPTKLYSSAKTSEKESIVSEVSLDEKLVVDKNISYDEDLQREIDKINEELKSGDITEKGYNRSIFNIYSEQVGRGKEISRQVFIQLTLFIITIVL